nr:hypothetical protein [Streptomyces cinnamoneus]
MARPGARRRPRLRLVQGLHLGVLPARHRRLPSVGLARHVGALGGTAPAVFNAANEECVDAFLSGHLPFNGIVDTVAEVVAEHGTPATGTRLTLSDVLQAETWARARARELAARSAARTAQATSEARA